MLKKTSRLKFTFSLDRTASRASHAKSSLFTHVKRTCFSAVSVHAVKFLPKITMLSNVCEITDIFCNAGLWEGPGQNQRLNAESYDAQINCTVHWMYVPDVPLCVQKST